MKPSLTVEILTYVQADTFPQATSLSSKSTVFNVFANEYSQPADLFSDTPIIKDWWSSPSSQLELLSKSSAWYVISTTGKQDRKRPILVLTLNPARGSDGLSTKVTHKHCLLHKNRHNSLCSPRTLNNELYSTMTTQQRVFVRYRRRFSLHHRDNGSSTTERAYSVDLNRTISIRWRSSKSTAHYHYILR